MYVGAWPKPGTAANCSPDRRSADGPEPVPAGADAWQAKRDDFLLMSFKPDLGQRGAAAVGDGRRPSGRRRCGSTSPTSPGKQLAGAVNALGYMRARETSVAACRLMNTLANQLHVPREQCRDVAERLMDGKFVCPLGGEYELVEVPGGQPMWTSTAIAPQNRFLLTAPPEDFQLPVLTWFKGLRGDVRLDDAELSAHVEIDMAKSAVP